MNVAIFLAGGIGKRFGTKTPKQFVDVCGKPLFTYAITTLENNNNIDSICFVCHPDYISFAKQKCEQYKIKKVKFFVPGGGTYIESFSNGLNVVKEFMTSNDNIVIVAADRPFISNKEINESIKFSNTFGSGIAAKDSDTCMFLLHENKTMSDNYLRENIVFVGTPWAFRFDLIYDSMKEYELGKIKSEPYPPAIFVANGNKAFFVKMSDNNFKITKTLDLQLMELILKKNK